MGFELLLAMSIAYYMTRNTVQDMAYAIRGEDPPSYRRERERWERRQAKRAEGDAPTKRLFANAWADACAAGDERRARMVERASERRRRKWADADADAAEVEAREINDRIDTHPEQVFQCGGCRQKITQSEVAGYALSGDPLCRTCRTSDAAHSSPDDTRRRCHTCRNLFAPADLVKASCETCPGDERHPVEACRGCVESTRRHQERADQAWDVGDKATPDPAAEPTSRHCPHCVAQVHYTDGFAEPFTVVHEPHCPRHPDRQRTPDAPAPASAVGDDDSKAPIAPVTDLAEWRSKGATPPITKEDIVSGETTNLAAALDYTQGMADQCSAGAASTETSIATLQNAKVSGPVLGHLATAQDLLTQAMAAFNAANSELKDDVVVKDAYQARQGAGDKEFATQE